MEDGGTLTYSITGLGGSGLSFNTTTGEISAMADMATAGTYSNIIITAYDDSAECMPAYYSSCRIDSNSFDIEISGASGDPTWTSNVPMMDTSLDYTVDDSVNISLSATSTPVGNGVTITASGLPPGLSISGNSIIGTLRNEGDYSIVLTATDDVNSNYIEETITFNVDPLDSAIVYFTDETPLEGMLKAAGYSASEYIDFIFRANINYTAMDIRYSLIANLEDVPGETVLEDELPSWLTWDLLNIGTSSGYAQITGTTPRQAIDYDYNFTVRAYDDTTFDETDTDTYNDRDYEINVLADATCVSPVNNVCS